MSRRVSTPACVPTPLSHARDEARATRLRGALASVFAVAVGLGLYGCYDTHPVTVESLESTDAGTSPDGDTMPTDMTANECDSCGPVEPDPLIGAFLGDFLGELESCCTDEGQCGIALEGVGCMERDQPGMPSEECPSQSLGESLDLGALGGLLELEGCCRPDGTCGFVDDVIGFGCTNALNEFLGGGGEGATCTYDGAE